MSTCPLTSNRQYSTSAGLPTRGQDSGFSVTTPLHTAHEHANSYYDIPKHTIQKSDLYILSPKTSEDYHRFLYGIDYHRFRYGLNKSPERHVTEIHTPYKYANARSVNYENRRFRQYSDKRHLHYGGLAQYAGKPTYQQSGANSKRASSLNHDWNKYRKTSGKSSYRPGTLYSEDQHGEFTSRKGTIHECDSDTGRIINIKPRRRHSADTQYHRHISGNQHHSDRNHSADYSPESHYHHHHHYHPDHHHSGHHHHSYHHHSAPHKPEFARSCYKPTSYPGRDNFENNARAIAILTGQGTPRAYEEPEEDKNYKGERFRGTYAIKDDYGYKGAITPHHQNRFDKHDVRKIHEHGHCKRHCIKPKIVINPPLVDIDPYVCHIQEHIEHGSCMRRKKHCGTDKVNPCHIEDCCDPHTDCSGMAECKDIAAAVRRRKTPEDFLRDLRVENSDEDCVARGTRFRECPEHVAKCDTYVLPHPYTRDTDLSRCFVRYGRWSDPCELEHCEDIGPCERDMGICPTVTKLTRHGRGSDEDLPASKFRQMTGTLEIPQFKHHRGEDMNREEKKNADYAHKRTYYDALKHGDFHFVAHCHHRKGGGLTGAPSRNVMSSQSHHRRPYCDDGANFNDVYSECVVRQRSFCYNTPQYFGIPCAPVNQMEPCLDIVPKIHVGKMQQGFGGMPAMPGMEPCACPAPGKRQHRCGFPTLHAEKHSKNPEEPFPHSRPWEQMAYSTMLENINKSSKSGKKWDKKSSDSARKSKWGDDKSGISSSLPPGKRSASPESKKEHTMFTHPPPSLCADASCVPPAKVCGPYRDEIGFSMNQTPKEGRSCTTSFASCKDLHRNLSPQTMQMMCLPSLFANPIPRFPMHDPHAKLAAKKIVDSLLDAATKKQSSRDSGSRKSKSSLKRSRSNQSRSSRHGMEEDSAKRLKTPFDEMSSAWVPPWCNDPLVGWQPSLGCTAVDEKCRYPQPYSNVSNRWPHYYKYLWDDMKTPIPNFRRKNCAKAFRTSHMTSNYNCYNSW